MYFQEKVLAPWLGDLTDRFARLRNTRSGRSQIASVRVNRTREIDKTLSMTDLDCEPKLIIPGH